MRLVLTLVAFMVSAPAFASDPITEFFKNLTSPVVKPDETIIAPRYRERRVRRFEGVNYGRGGNAMATWYGHEVLRTGSGRTANGERFNPSGLTAAHKTLPFGTRVQITSPVTGRSVIVRINDRGPFRKGYSYDLARGASFAIGHKGSGAIIATVLN